ncbi:ParB N-terminal domain-containing protein [Sulfoacidibacillus ferrooxidans]|uniref:ParB-like N-terminal domain-containing protein n=1 Tax=Sulfoacidibacillus ferrooxidans TaxID=2005001 RepID=A0A9X2AD41_9BACL|nr:ParB N-terminal domain-containing protein [Sulfoacidibacillus ferrooxidans]MCI0184853.1 hypothetical protein [Sulfoacidibacillus ferrooxidans]
MAANIIVTGPIFREATKHTTYYTVEIKEKGSSAPAKGLPAGNEIIFTIFVSLQSATRIHLDKLPLGEHLWVQGELVTDRPTSECPSGIGVIALHVDLLPAKNKREAPKQQNHPDPHHPIDLHGVQQVKQKEPFMISIDQLQIPERFLTTILNRKKTQALELRVQKTGELDQPIQVEIKNKDYWIIDGYRRYVVAKQLHWEQVPILVVASDEHEPVVAQEPPMPDEVDERPEHHVPLESWQLHMHQTLEGTCPRCRQRIDQHIAVYQVTDPSLPRSAKNATMLCPDCANGQPNPAMIGYQVNTIVVHHLCRETGWTALEAREWLVNFPKKYVFVTMSRDHSIRAYESWDKSEPIACLRVQNNEINFIKLKKQ